MVTSSLTPGTFPPEILTQVFDHLTIWDLTELSGVNKQWRAHFKSRPELWRKLDFGNLWFYTRGVDTFNMTAMARFFVSKTNGELNQLSIRRIREMTCDWHVVSLEHCSKLVDLSLDRFGGDMHSLYYIAGRLPSLKRLDIVAEFDISIPLQFLQNSLMLESASFTFTTAKYPQEQCVFAGMISPALKSLRFVGEYFRIDTPPLRFPDNLITKALRLERLSVEACHEPITADYRHLNELREIQISDCEMVKELFVPRNITVLAISLTNLAAIPLDSLQELEILTLNIRSNEYRSKYLDTAFQGISRDLQKLSLKFYTDSNWSGSATLEEEVVSIISRTNKIANISCLAIWLSRSIPNSFLELIAVAFPGLKDISIRGDCSKISDDALKAFLGKLLNLRISFFDLHRHLEDSMLQWIREQDVEVNYNPPFECYLEYYYSDEDT